MMPRSRSRLSVVTAAAAFALASVAALWSDSVDAGNRGRYPVLRQITRNTVGYVGKPGVRLERAETIAFVSDGDVLGPGTATGHREVYLYHQPTSVIRRLTATLGGESYDPIRETDETYSRRPRYVVVVSTGDLDPRVDNSDGNPEIFIHLTESGETRQITDTAAGIRNLEPYSSDHGQCIVWRSNGDHENNDGSDPQNPSPGYDNTDASDEIFMLRFDDDALSRWMIT
ncbi:MAG TPA: hypothetical protein VFO62_05350, partial [Candidatus Binatia bacterium]|nr:hypothetical protein [Candidatus Binatia bacterium]